MSGTETSMDFRWSVEDENFRQQLRSWLRVELADRKLTTYQETSLDKLLSWEQALRDEGLNAVSWPENFGGQGMSPTRQLVFNDEYERAHAPRRLNFPALGLLGPTLMAIGNPQQQHTLLPRILSGEDVWCQGFSEPGAGSDLGSLTTRAVRAGDCYVVNGQKTWCSNAGRATKMFCLVRTGEPDSRTRGISYLLIDLSLPGVEVRPIRQVGGGSEFAEVFLTDVRVPVDCLVGSENDGWRVANTTLGIERGASRYPASYFRRMVEDAERIAAAQPGGVSTSDAVAFARMQADVACWEIDSYASVTAPREHVAGLDAVFKLNRSQIQQRIYEHGLRSLGPSIEALPGALPAGVSDDFYQRYWHSRASSIYAGTNEVHLNIIAERVLALPREPRR